MHKQYERYLPDYVGNLRKLLFNEDSFLASKLSLFNFSLASMIDVEEVIFEWGAVLMCSFGLTFVLRGVE